MSDKINVLVKKIVSGSEITEEDIVKANMSETDIIDVLNGMKDDIKIPNAQTGARSVYLGGGWFDTAQIKLLIEQYRALLLNDTIGHIHVPLLHQYNGTPFNSESGEDMGFEWATMTYKADIKAIDNSDIAVVSFPAGHEDAGTAVEVGYAIGTNKPVVALYAGDIDKNPINLMVSFGVDAYADSEGQLRTFDFIDIAPRKYRGKII